MSLAELRACTRPLHERLDNRLNLFSTVQSRAEYREHLYRFYQLLHCVEKELPRFPEWQSHGIDWQEREKCSLLRADLQALGCKENLENPELPAELPPLNNFAESVGSLYVLEGSTLGAQYISRHFGEKLRINAASGMAFHTGYGPATSAMWKEFCAALEAIFRENPHLKEQALNSACAAFSAVENALCAPVAARKSPPCTSPPPPTK